MTDDLKWHWLPWKYNKVEPLDESIWGPRPSWWEYCKAHWINQLRLFKYHKIMRTVCKIRGHQEIELEPSELHWYGGKYCERCLAQWSYLENGEVFGPV